jgi:hypothetical protein
MSGFQFDPGVDSIIVSLDGGATWRRHRAPSQATWVPLCDQTVTPPNCAGPPQPRWVEPLAWDSAGALYAFWAADSTLWLGRSADQGASWATWPVAHSAGVPYYPYLIARGDGDLGASWFSGKGDSLRANVARIRVGAGAGPLVALVPPFAIESWALPGFGPPDAGDPGGEYLPLVFLTDGSLGLVSPIQHAAAKRMGFTWRRYVTAP